MRKVKVDIPVPSGIPKGENKILLRREVQDQIDSDLEEVSAMFPLRFVDRVLIEKPLNTSRARIILNEVKKEK